jgi:hypothetical protein
MEARRELLVKEVPAEEMPAQAEVRDKRLPQTVPFRLPQA